MRGRWAIATSRAGVVRAGLGTTLVISNEDMVDTVRTIKSLENSDVLIGGVSETRKHEIKKQENGFLSMFLETLGASMLGKLLTGKSVMIAGRGYNMDHMDKIS